MNVVLKIVGSYIRQYPGRLILTSLAMIASACMVVWVVSGYDALVAQFDEFSDEYMGQYHFYVVPPVSDLRPGSPPSGEDSVPQDIIAVLQADPSVASVDLGVQAHVEILPFETSGASVGLKDSPRGQRGPQGSEADRGDRSGRGGPGGGRGGQPGGGSGAGRGGRPGGAASGGSRGTGGSSGLGRGGPLFRYISLIGTTADSPPYPMTDGSWIDTGKIEFGDTIDAVISRGSAEAFGVSVGDEFVIKFETNTQRLKLVGIVDQVRSLPSVGRGSPAPSRGPATTALYIPMLAMGKVTGQEPRIDYAAVAMKEMSAGPAFESKWTRELASMGSKAELQSATDIEQDLSAGRSVASMRGQAYSATGISMLASLFIIFTTLSMGVHERTRQFAVLRAIALTKGQVAAIISVESIVLGLIGWLGGLAAGWLLLQVVAWSQPDFLRNGATLGSWSIMLSGICAFGGAIVAAVIPAWRATRVSPLDAMAPQPISPGTRYIVPAVVVGLTLIFVNPLLVFYVPMSDESRYGIYAALGCSTMAVGFLLLTPLAISITERYLAAPLAWLFRLDSRLLESQLSSNFWRTLGTSVALTLGLGLFIATQVWGYSMLGPFVPGEWAPDTLVNFTTGGLPDSEWEAVAHATGVKPQRCLPLAVEQPKLVGDITGSEERSSVARQDNIVLIGIDPERGIGADDPLLHLDFVDGDRVSAAKRMKETNACVVPDHFAKASGLKIGDSFELIPPYSPDKTVRYEIAGVVHLQGWHWMTKFSGLRRQSGRSAAMVFADFDDVRRDFNLPETNFFWMDTEPGVDYAKLGSVMQTIGDRYEGERQPVNGQGTWEFAARNFGSTVRITTVDDVRERIQGRAAGMIWGMGQLPLVTLAVSAIGVLNTILASVRTRQWDMGVMRSLGLTRWGLVRMILAEGILIGLVACVLSAGFGVMAGWCGVGISQYVSFFGGMAPTLILPWNQLLFGCGITLLLCLAAALWPAISAGRQEPLRLLQAGRTVA
ncbi:ABC transporter permease [Blastopirellula marina]|uniref:ABC transporter permease n=1 Tax=Blastopirellula marina TaxID=124 RepID=A0A2S8F381_9BACT|nr:MULTISPECIES: ABC transporter permease [Pirellulaceae]PQO26384.1 ABC transporter permease [Blastopirellula marina]RCS44840.1 ABC transporter permease [Bremerella cremea]